MSRTTFHVRWHRMLKSVMLIQGGRERPSPKVRAFCNRGWPDRGKFCGSIACPYSTGLCSYSQKTEEQEMFRLRLQCTIVIFEMFTGQRSTLENGLSGVPVSESTRGQKGLAESQGCHLWAVGRGMFCRKVSKLRKHSDGIVCLFSFDLCMAHATKFLHLSAQGKELPQLVDDSFTATKGLGACEHFQVTNLLETTA